jgi:AcrR family transcriptional regulator
MIFSKNKIALVAFSLAMENGFDNVSIKQIQEESGLSAGTIYYYFKDKNEILVYMLHLYLIDNLQEYREEIKKFNGSFIEKIDFLLNYKSKSFIKEEFEINISTGCEYSHKKYLTFLTTTFHQHPEFRYLFHESHDRLYDFYYELIEEAIENKEIREDIDVKMLVIFVQTIIKGYTELWVYQPNLSLEKIIDANIKLMWEAIKKQ